MSKPYVVGIDIGGTNTVFGIVDARGVVIASSSIKTKKHTNLDDYIDELHQELTKLLDANDATDKVHGIGTPPYPWLNLSATSSACRCRLPTTPMPPLSAR